MLIAVFFVVLPPSFWELDAQLERAFRGEIAEKVSHGGGGELVFETVEEALLFGRGGRPHDEHAPVLRAPIACRMDGDRAPRRSRLGLICGHMSKARLRRVVHWVKDFLVHVMYG